MSDAYSRSAELFLNREFFGHTVREQLLVLLGILIALALVRLFQVIVLTRLRRIFARTPTGWDDLLVEALDRDVVPALYVIIVYLGLRDFPWRDSLRTGLRAAATVAVTFLAVRAAIAVINHSLHAYWKRHAADRTRERERNLTGITAMIKVVVWALGFILLLDNLGIRVSAFMAGLGITGIAVALAAQAILGDLFSYFVIFFDQPFEIGNVIRVGDLQGEVEHIGLKTTRLRSAEGEQIIISNKALTDAKVQNFKRMKRRRVVYQLDFDGATPPESLRALPELVRAQYAGHADVTFERCHFIRFSDGNPRFEIAYVVETPDFQRHLDVQHEANLGLHRALDREGIRFAAPGRVVRFRSGGRKAADAEPSDGRSGGRRAPGNAGASESPAEPRPSSAEGPMPRLPEAQGLAE